MGSSIYHATGSAKGEGVDEMTINDHEGRGEGFRNDHVVTWSGICFLCQIKKLLREFFFRLVLGGPGWGEMGENFRKSDHVVYGWHLMLDLIIS